MADPKVQLTFAKTFEGTNLFQILPQGGWTQHERQLLELSIDQDGKSWNHIGSRSQGVFQHPRV
jgi:hypothetical protein